VWNLQYGTDIFGERLIPECLFDIHEATDQCFSQEIDTLLKEKRFFEAKELILERLRIHKATSELYYLLGKCYCRIYDKKNARSALEFALRGKLSFTVEGDIYLRFALLFAETDFTYAKEYFSRVIEHSPENPVPYCALFLLHMERDEIEQALLYKEKVKTFTDPKNYYDRSYYSQNRCALVCNYKAEKQFKDKNFHRALELYLLALEIDPLEPETYHHIIDTYLELRQYEKAQAYIVKFTEEIETQEQTEHSHFWWQSAGLARTLISSAFRERLENHTNLSFDNLKELHMMDCSFQKEVKWKLYCKFIFARLCNELKQDEYALSLYQSIVDAINSSDNPSLLMEDPKLSPFYKYAFFKVENRIETIPK
jgi:tetratricopeptide (TPR) repeat protein